jgi:hypothetical protein
MENHGLESVVDSSSADVQLPQNSNDAVWDVSDSSTVRPLASSGFSDMTLALVQYEAAAFLRHVLVHSAPYNGQEQEYADFHDQLRQITWDALYEKHLAGLDRTVLQQCLIHDIADLTFQRTHLTQLRPLVRASACILTATKALCNKYVLYTTGHVFADDLALGSS